MTLTKEQIQITIKKYGKNDTDTGSTEVQIALLTIRIQYLTEHAKTHKKDNHSRRGLVMLVAERRKMLKYLRRTDPASYVKITQELSIRRN
tara:strand:- start:182 stop:454 length:273 start_codon:yes stop_codon:yes gene_type:complete